jgi:PhnB protein
MSDVRGNDSAVISLMVAVPDAAAAADWYRTALGAKELWNLGSVVGLEVGGAPFFLAEPASNGWESPATIGTTTVRIEVFVDDPDAFVARAVEAGADGSVDRVRDHEAPWGTHRQGGFVDPFGHRWLVGDRSPLRLDMTQTARIQLEALQNVTARLVAARDTAAAVETVLSHGLPAVGASSGAVLVYDAERERLTMERAIGYPPGILDHLQEIPLDADIPAAVAARTREPVLLRSLSEIDARFPAMGDVFRSVGGAGAVLPLVSRHQLVGSIVFVFETEQEFADEHLRAISTFAALCAEALDRASEHEEEHRIATTLQRSLLPAALPSLDGVDLAGRYLPAAGAGVGGDWYDAAVVGPGQLVVSVGDVGGKGVAAAALMGRLRIAAKAYAMEGHTPAQIVARLDRFGASLPEIRFTTLVILSFEPASGSVRLCRAGHLPPVVLPADGSPSFVWDGGSTPIGLGLAVDAIPPTDACFQLGRGDALLAYTDGLIERRGKPLDSGLRDLLAAIPDATRVPTARRIADDVVQNLLGSGTAAQDDIALVALRYES